MKCHGYLFGVIKILEDTHHDECFVEKINYVIIRNGVYLYSFHELVAIARDMGVNPWRLTLIDLTGEL